MVWSKMPRSQPWDWKFMYLETDMALSSEEEEADEEIDAVLIMKALRRGNFKSSRSRPPPTQSMEESAGTSSLFLLDLCYCFSHFFPVHGGHRRRCYLSIYPAFIRQAPPRHLLDAENVLRGNAP